MFRTIRVGRLFGFPVEVNLSFLLLLGFFVVWLGPITGMMFVAIAFGSVLLHELGHALMARHLRIPVAGIELHFFGGAAKLMAPPRTPGDEIAVAAAGPAVSFALGGLGLAIAALTGWQVASLLGWINLIMALFNLVPALPLDGGRIFRALLQRRTGFLRATEISVAVARVAAVSLGVIGLFTLHLYFVLLAVLLWSMGTAELAVARHNAPLMQEDTVRVYPNGYVPEDPKRPPPGGPRIVRVRLTRP
ncbi:MAG TPA: M50 family metallopeptidase [Kofleriaceae bacterium]|nr:M50 family metallopeptidase [Kofleriaceae bacterium]